MKSEETKKILNEYKELKEKSAADDRVVELLEAQAKEFEEVERLER